ncbi:MAG: hypothetical protein A2X94_00075 [Bdellovibrionales bacterium GWB1_55_8]|nr:MAG: hypothetical protein A2X94_00075 [Bdellovibrionales bacterium GWB1_55_8]
MKSAREKWIRMVVGVAVFVAFAAAGSAQAARIAQVEVDQAEARQGPGTTSQVLFRLKKGAWVYSSNLPTEGYFKVRSREGGVGWVPTDAIRQHVRKPLGTEEGGAEEASENQGFVEDVQKPEDNGKPEEF